MIKKVISILTIWDEITLKQLIEINYMKCVQPLGRELEREAIILLLVFGRSSLSMGYITLYNVVLDDQAGQNIIVLL